jgi:putative membrane protein
MSARGGSALGGKLFLKWLIMAVSILIAAKLIPGVAVSGVWAALMLAVFLAVINIIIRPILIIVTLPINILTLGLFTFVINALLVWLSSSIIEGFDVAGFLPALYFSVILSVISYLLNTVFGTK